MSVKIAVTQDIGACHDLRRAVFITEQGIAEADEMDDLDDGAIHLLATDGGQPVGTARLLLKGDTGKIGRLCVLSSHRGTGLGAALVRTSVDHFRTLPGLARAYLSAQEYAVGFYEKLGFTAYGGTYDDAGIPHRDMELRF